MSDYRGRTQPEIGRVRRVTSRPDTVSPPKLSSYSTGNRSSSSYSQSCTVSRPGKSRYPTGHRNSGPLSGRYAVSPHIGHVGRTISPPRTKSPPAISPYSTDNSSSSSLEESHDEVKRYAAKVRQLHSPPRTLSPSKTSPYCTDNSSSSSLEGEIEEIRKVAKVRRPRSPSRTISPPAISQRDKSPARSTDRSAPKAVPCCAEVPRPQWRPDTIPPPDISTRPTTSTYRPTAATYIGDYHHTPRVTSSSSTLGESFKNKFSQVFSTKQSSASPLKSSYSGGSSSTGKSTTGSLYSKKYISTTGSSTRAGPSRSIYTSK